jgi:hypothetical protein
MLDHALEYVADPDAPLVKLPVKPWTGRFDSVSRDEITTVNMRGIGDLVENVVATLRKEHANKRLELRLSLP